MTDFPKQSLIQAAKQGNARAIETLLNQSLQPKAIAARVRIKDECIQIILELKQTSERQNLIERIKNGLKILEIDSINKVRIYGRQIGDETQNWSYSFNLQPNKDAGSVELKLENKHKKLNNFVKKTDVKGVKQATIYSKENGRKSIETSQKASQSLWHKRITKISLVGLLVIFATSLLTLAVNVISKVAEENQILESKIDEFSQQYGTSSDIPQEGIDRLNELSKKYKGTFWSKLTECSSFDPKDLELEKQRELEALRSWELAFVNKQEQIKLFGKPQNNEEESLFRNFLNISSDRIRLEKRCNINALTTFPLQTINISNENYPYITKVDENSELGYLTFAYVEQADNNPNSQRLAFQRANEEYIKSKIENLSSIEIQMPLELKSGYMLCQAVRNTMMTQKLSVQDSISVLTSNNPSVNSALPIQIQILKPNTKQQYVAIALKNLCPQLLK